MSEVTHEEHAQFGTIKRASVKWGLHWPNEDIEITIYSRWKPEFPDEPVLVITEGDDLWILNKARWEELKDLARVAGFEDE